MQKTTLEQWRMFKAVADAGGFNQASEKIHKSQSSIHRAVGNLEALLGVSLFRTEGRRLVLTDIGALMLRRGEYLLEEVERIETVAESLSAGVESELRIAVDGAFPQTFIVQALEKVSALYPQLRIDIIDTVLSGTNELISEARADIGLSPLMMPGGLNEEICVIEFVAVAHRDHPLHALGRTLGYEDIKSYRQIIVRDSAQGNKTNSGWLGAEQRWTVSHLRASIALIEQNLGFAWLPLPAISDQLEKGILKTLAVEEGARRSASFYLNYADKDSLGPAAREFMGELRLLTFDLPSS